MVIGGEVQPYKYSEIPAEYFDRINKAFIDVMAKGTGTGIPFTFPLISIQIDDNFKYDNPMFLYFLDKMYYFNGAYFENFKTAPFSDEYYKSINPYLQARDPSVSRSLCPLDSKTPIVYYSEKLRRYITTSIKEIYDTYATQDRTVKVLQNGNEVNCKINKFERDEFYTVTLANGLSFTSTHDHLNKTSNGTKMTTELTEEDYLPIGRKPLNGGGMTYEDGLFVGAFLGNGSYYKGRSDNCNKRVVFSLSAIDNKEMLKELSDIARDKFGAYTAEYLQTSSISGKQSCINLSINSEYLVGLIKQFTKGDNALNKEIDLLACTQSLNFRKGLVDGLYRTDGGNNNRIYTSSKKLVESLTTLCATMGIPVNITEDNREGRLSTNPCYTVRLYMPDEIKTQYKGVYYLDDDYFWFKIKSIEKAHKGKSVAYCLEVVDEGVEPIFMMANGIITHNCRLQISLSTLKGLSSGGIFGSSVGNVGAIQVIDLNMNRLLIEYGHDIPLLKEKMTYYLNLIEDGHMAKRRWIESHKELYPTFFAFNDNLKNYFNVFGDIGYHEGLINIGYKDGINDPEGKKLAHELKQHMQEVVNSFIERDGVACGIEASPAENAGIKLARNDIKFAKSIDKEIFTQGKGKDVYLTAGCMTPFAEDNFTLQIENAAEFQGYYTSGSILHHFIESKIEPEILAKYIDNLFKKPINYITLTPTLSSCMACGQTIIATDGRDIKECPKCHSDDIATFSRVIGYSKMISRKGIKVKNGLYDGEYNFWSKPRRYDWNTRRRIKEGDMSDVQ